MALLKPESRIEQYLRDIAKNTAAIAEGVGGGGGENPNTVETYTGKLDDILQTNDLSAQELGSAIIAGNASAWMEVEGSAVQASDIVVSAIVPSTETPTSLFFNGVQIESEGNVLKAIDVEYAYSDSDLELAYVILAGDFADMTSAASSIPVTLHVIRHPLPENP